MDKPPEKDARIGYMFANLPLRDIPLDMVLNLFKIYILGLFQFGLPIWRVQCAKSAWDQLDATFTKYLKSYLGVPKYSNNAIVHHLCGTIPFSVYMKNRIQYVKLLADAFHKDHSLIEPMHLPSI